jgi:hypothetical protein
MNLIKIHLTLILFLCSTRIFAGSVTVSDFDITAFTPSNTPYLQELSALFGSYDSVSQTFTPLLVSSPTVGVNTGYLDNDEKEFQLTLTQGNNNNVAEGSFLFVAIYEGTTYNSSVTQIVLGDASWIAPEFDLTTPVLTWALTASTTAYAVGGVIGTYNFNNGAPQVTLEVVPEPSTYALLALGGLALAGHVIRRRRRA